MGFYDSQTGIPYDCSYGARCVQRLDDSQVRANRITFRISLRSSSLQEPRDPLLKVLVILMFGISHDLKYIYYTPKCASISLSGVGFNV